MCKPCEVLLKSKLTDRLFLTCPYTSHCIPQNYMCEHFAFTDMISMVFHRLLQLYKILIYILISICLII